MTFDWNTFLFGAGEAFVLFLTFLGIHFINKFEGYDYPIESEDDESITET